MMTLGLVYFVFAPSIATTLMAGAVVRRTGTRLALWGGLGTALVGLPLLLTANLPIVLVGLALVAAGTFFAQAVATGFVGRTASANRGAASGLYLASYFSGGLFGTAVLGGVFGAVGWGACVAGIAMALAVAAVLAIAMRD